MADVQIGNIQATLSLNAQQFQQGMAAALASLQQFQTAAQHQGGGAAQLTINTQQFQQSITAALASLQQFQAAVQHQAGRTTQLPVNTTQFQQAMTAALTALQRFQTAAQQQGGAAPQAFTRTSQAAQQLTAQLAQLTQHASTQTAALGQMTAGLGRTEAATQSLGAQVAQLSQHLGRMGASAQTGTGHIESFGSAWRGVLQVAGGLGLVNSIQAIARALAEFAQSAVEVGVRMESLRASLSALAGSVPAGTQQFQQLFQMAQQLGVPFEALAKGWRTLTAAATQAGLPLTEQLQLLRVLATEARRLGLSQEELGRVINGVAQTFAKGKVQMEEVRGQIGEAMPTALGAMARGLGRTTAELEKLFSTGAVGSVELARAMIRGFEQIQQASGEFVGGSQAAFNQLGNALLAFKDAVAQNVLPELVEVAKIVQGLLEHATALMNIAGGPRGTRLTSQGVKPTAEEIAEEARLEQEVRRLERPPLAGEYGFFEDATKRRAEDLVAAQMALDAYRAQVKEVAARRAEEEQAAQATAKQAGDLGIQRTHLVSIASKMDEIRKARAEFGREAALAPELYGRPGGTVEEQEKYTKELQGRLRPMLEDLTKLATQPPIGITVPPEVLKQVRDLAAEHGRLDQTLETLHSREMARKKAEREAEQARQKELREAEQERLKAIREAAEAPARISQIQTTLERAQGLIGRPGMDLGEQARQKTLQQFAETRNAMTQALDQIREHPAIAQLAPQLKAQLEEALAGLGEAAGTQAQVAFDKVNAHMVDRVARLGDQIGDLGDRIGTAGLSPVAEAMARVNRDFQRMVDQLEQFQRVLAELAVGATPAAAAAIDQQQARIQALLERVPAARARAQATVGLEATYPQRQREFERLQDMEDRLDEMRQQPGFFGERPISARERRQMGFDIGSVEGEKQMARLEAQMKAQERLNYAAERFEEFAGSVGSAWGSALNSIANGTATVSEAFKQMAQSIIQSLGQIAAQEAFRGLIRLGVGLITGGLTPTIGATTPGGGYYQAPAGGGAPFLPPPVAFQHGGQVHRPTLAMIGEGASHTLPETVLNRPQMEGMLQAAMHRGSAAAGQAAGGAGIVIVNVATEGQAEQERLKREGLGFQVVINHVLKELSSGESSKINRAMRNLSR